MRKRIVSLFPLILSATICITGCATVRTMPTLGSYGSPKIYSGTRLDYNAAAEDRAGLENFTVSPPDHPMLDIAFSAILDTIILPVTGSVALYEIIFKQ